MRIHWMLAWVVCVGCGGSADNGGSGASGGSAGSGASAASGGSGASGGSAGSGGSGASGGSGGSGGDSLNHCRVPSDCVVIPASCCGACGAATREDSVAVNKGLAAYAQNLVCGDDGACPGCYMPSDASLIATCTAWKCQVVDLLASAATECEANTDCRLRTNQCCECGGSQDVEHLIAVSDSSPLEQLVCDPNIACTECDPGEPVGVEAQCQGGRCVVQWLLGN